MAAFLLWPLAVLELGPRVLAHLIRTLAPKTPRLTGGHAPTTT
ncbi:hypothetical protein OG298_45250 (plasmid) [Streptomyces sp. NBC_01005]|nr:hypothetical protein OG298_45250 [Streptomyces sp. NBC_01005]